MWTKILSSLFQILFSKTKQGVSYFIARFGCSSPKYGCLGPFKFMSLNIILLVYSPSTNIVSYLMWQKLCKTQHTMIIRGAYQIPTYIFFKMDHLFFNILNVFSILPFLSSYFWHIHFDRQIVSLLQCKVFEFPPK